jgi:hypothetical protein
MLENAFLNISDLGRAQELSDDFDVARFHIVLDELAARFCPVTKTLDRRCHWSIMQAEYATDILFKNRESLAAIYENLTRTAIHTVKPEKVATFLGRKLSPLYLQELGNDFSTRTEGTCVKHHMGPASIKMYDKFGMVLRIETTVNNVSFFKHYRMVEQHDGKEVFKLACMKKSISSLPDLDNLCHDANRRYLEFLSEIDDHSAGQSDLNRVSSPRSSGGRSYRGFNFFSEQDHELLLAVARGEHLISGLRSEDIHCRLPGKSPGWISRSLKRLRIHGIIRRIGKTSKYYLTVFGKRIIATGTHLKELFLVPHLAASSGVPS